MRYRPIAAAAVIISFGAGEAFAQSAPSSGPAATPPTPGPSSGTAPGNSGSTGWTGGLGGSHTGTSPHAPTSGSPNTQPPTSTGLDPTKPEDPKR